MRNETYTPEQYAKDLAQFRGRDRNPQDGSTWCSRSDSCVLGYGHKGPCCVDPMDLRERSEGLVRRPYRGIGPARRLMFSVFLGGKYR